MRVWSRQLQRRAERAEVRGVVRRVDHAALAGPPTPVAAAPVPTVAASASVARNGLSNTQRRHLVDEPVVVQPGVHVAPRPVERPVEAHVLRQVLGHRRRFDLVADVVRRQTAAAVPLLAAVVHLRRERLVGRDVHDDVGALTQHLHVDGVAVDDRRREQRRHERREDAVGVGRRFPDVLERLLQRGTHRPHARRLLHQQRPAVVADAVDDRVVVRRHREEIGLEVAGIALVELLDVLAAQVETDDRRRCRTDGRPAR